MMAATHYMIFGRLIVYVGERFSPVRAKRVTMTFVAFDVASFVVQGAGGSLYSSNNVNLYNTAKAILVVGFLIQIISFGVFGICAGICEALRLSCWCLPGADMSLGSIDQRRVRRAGVAAGNWSSVLTTLYFGPWSLCRHSSQYR